MFFIYTYLHFEISKIAKCTLKLRPNSVQYRKFLRECNSRESICTSITRIQHEYCTFNYGWMLPQNPNFKTHNPTSDRLESIASLTPAEYVKRDKERRLRERELQRKNSNEPASNGEGADAMYEDGASVNTGDVTLRCDDN
ncbi:hypothetical protein QE152_g16082 [Popillia japonica]|uniref:Uncharacterized protein n=1 Tax=Popillia japonica TaxID=7064 RepID=A0AAW1L3R1_POPJA